MKYYFITYQCYYAHDSSTKFLNTVINIHPFEWLKKMKEQEYDKDDNFVGTCVLINYQEIDEAWYNELNSGVFLYD